MRLKLVLLISIALLTSGTLMAQRQREERADVSIKNRAYTPATLRIKKGGIGHLEEQRQHRSHGGFGGWLLLFRHDQEWQDLQAHLQKGGEVPV